MASVSVNYDEVTVTVKLLRRGLVLYVLNPIISRHKEPGIPRIHLVIANTASVGKFHLESSSVQLQVTFREVTRYFFVTSGISI